MTIVKGQEYEQGKKSNENLHGGLTICTLTKILNKI